MYNQVLERGACMPLLMGYSQPEKIEEIDEPIVYDQVRQIAIIHPFVMRTAGTYSLKTVFGTKKVGNTKVSDQKNAIDDQKTVK